MHFQSECGNLVLNNNFIDGEYFMLEFRFNQVINYSKTYIHILNVNKYSVIYFNNKS